MVDDEEEDMEDLSAAWGNALEEQGAGDAEELTAQWASLIDEPAAQQESSHGSDRLLNQDEIDNLMGFKLDPSITGDQNGIRALINSAMVSYERLPMLEVIFDRLVRLTTTSLRNFTSDNVEVSLDSISSVRFGDYLNSMPLPAILSVFKAEEWNNNGLITIDSPLIYSIIDVLLGGGRANSAVRVDGRPYTTIELNLVRQLMELILHDSELAFEPLTPVTFTLDRMETNPRFATIARQADAAILVQFRIDMEDRGGKVEFLLPYATIDPIRKLLLQMFTGEKFGQDKSWEKHLSTQTFQAEVQVDAVLAECDIPIGEVRNLKVGHTIMLGRKPNDLVDLKVEKVSLSNGTIGQMEDHIAIQVGRNLKPQKMTLEAFESAIADMEITNL